MSLVLDGTNGLSEVDGSAATPAIRGTDTNTGIFFPAADTIAFAEGGAEVAQFNSAGNFGLKVTPSASWQAGRAVMQIGPAMAFDCNNQTQAIVSANRVFTGSQDLYLNSGNATAYQQFSGAHSWFTAPSGTAGNAISFTQAMTLDASGNLGVGTTASSARLRLQVPLDTTAIHATDGTRGDFFVDFPSSSVTRLTAEFGAGGNLVFANGNTKTERARINSSGNLIVGGTSDVNSARLTVTKGSAAMGMSAYIGNGNSTLNTISVSTGGGGGMCIISGVDFQSGASFSRIFAVGVRVSGGTASVATQIGSSGGAATFTFGESGGLLTITASGFSGFGASWTAMFINC